MKTTLSALTLLLFICFSCTSPVDEHKIKQDEIIAIHDEVMPLMGDFAKKSIHIDSLLLQLPQVTKNDSAVDSTQARLELGELKVKLDQASESMNDWMYEFETDYEGMSKEEIDQYLDGQLVKINEVKGYFVTASKQSDALLSQYTISEK